MEVPWYEPLNNTVTFLQPISTAVPMGRGWAWTGGSQPVSIAAVPKNKKFAMRFYESFIYRYYFNNSATNVY